MPGESSSAVVRAPHDDRTVESHGSSRAQATSDRVVESWVRHGSLGCAVQPDSRQQIPAKRQAKEEKPSRREVIPGVDAHLDSYS